MGGRLGREERDTTRWGFDELKKKNNFFLLKGGFMPFDVDGVLLGFQNPPGLQKKRGWKRRRIS